MVLRVDIPSSEKYGERIVEELRFYSPFIISR
jgi:hypothetical protein